MTDNTGSSFVVIPRSGFGDDHGASPEGEDLVLFFPVILRAVPPPEGSGWFSEEKQDQVLRVAQDDNDPPRN